MNKTMNKRIWPRPVVIPLPDETMGSGDVSINLLEEDWSMNLYPPQEFWKKDMDLSGWEKIGLPMQVDAPDREYAFAKDIHIPDDWKDSRIMIRFDGVNCYGRVFVDGQYVMDHYGGFVSWDCDITDYTAAGKTSRLTIGVTDKNDDVCEFHKGGILRDIILVRLPHTYLFRLHADTILDAACEDAVLRVYAGLKGTAALVRFLLTDPSGNTRELGTVQMQDNADTSYDFSVSKPLKWDCEHPYLYTLTAEVITDGSVMEKTHRRIGFRMLKKRGNQVFLNQQELKLHGVNHHDIHPVMGRAISRELARRDVQLFKEANVNFIRTSHYPPRTDFLDFCDEYGIYVEDEIAVAFLGQGTDCRQNDPAYTAAFLGQFSEMIERDRSHPSVILYSLANESIWGSNFELENRYAHEEDPSRLTIFSYPITQKEDDDRADIWSMHYASWDQSPTALVDSFNRSEHEPWEWPVLHDESTHIPCYCRNDLKRDPGVRDFWGITIRDFYNRLYETKGALGCAIWAGIDDIRKGNLFQPQWGIIDGWRRKKPEFYHVRKAYSPVCLKGKPYSRDGKIAFVAENRFCHTDFAQMKILWAVTDSEGNRREGSMMAPSVSPRETGEIILSEAYCEKNRLELTFFDAFGYDVNEEAFVLGEEDPVCPSLTGMVPQVTQQEDRIVISGNGFSYTLDQRSGLFLSGTRDGNLVMTGGPYLHLTGLALENWERDAFCWEMTDAAVFHVNGHYGRVGVRFDMSIDAEGLLKVVYTVTDMPYPSPRKVAMRIGDDTDSGGYEEAGIFFIVPHRLDTLTWDRKGEWSVYPDWHIGRNHGTAAKHSSTETTKPDEKPVHEYQEDEQDTVLFGPYDPGDRGTRDFCSMKSYITKAVLTDGTNGFAAYSDGSDSVRIRLQHKPELVVNDRDPRLVYEGSWIKMDTKNRSLCGTETWSKQAGDTCTLRFFGTGAAFVSASDLIGGFARVYVDGVLADERINLGARQQTVGAARGYEKEYRRLVFSVKDLQEGEHELKIEVAGEHMPGAMGDYVFIDHFLIYNGDSEGDSAFIIDSEFNYPELSWGCYTKPPVRVESGYSKTVYVQLL